jgi:hypothetical protein
VVDDDNAFDATTNGEIVGRGDPGDPGTHHDHSGGGGHVSGR